MRSHSWWTAEAGCGTHDWPAPRSTLLSEGRWDLHMGLLQRAKDATQSSANHHRDTDLTGLAFSHFAVVAQRGSHNFSKVRRPSGSQAGDGSRYT